MHAATNFSRLVIAESWTNPAHRSKLLFGTQGAGPEPSVSSQHLQGLAWHQSFQSLHPSRGLGGSNDDSNAREQDRVEAQIVQDTCAGACGGFSMQLFQL